ncbi:MAG: SDR family NAD(P)-dependent oxidoreductase [Erysipelotrichaceae bacterium]|nr:SDR family NAD(P)-dependent oxidoreductase [Erysipelotrichaceae bacterium]
MKIAVITGGGSGLGSVYLAAIRKRYPELDEYWIIDIQKDKLEEIAKADLKIVPVVMNLADGDSFPYLQKQLEEKNADIRILINNAGVETVASFEDAPEVKLVNTVKVNAEAVMRIDKTCIPFMNEGSFIIHTASIYAFSPVPGDAVYAASKAFVRSLSMALHEELKKKGINVLTLSPGSMRTPMDRSDLRKKKGISMPFLNMEEVAAGALERAEKGRSVYIPNLYYRVYACCCKVLPSTLTARILGKNYR